MRYILYKFENFHPPGFFHWGKKVYVGIMYFAFSNTYARKFQWNHVKHLVIVKGDTKRKIMRKIHSRTSWDKVKYKAIKRGACVLLFLAGHWNDFDFFFISCVLREMMENLHNSCLWNRRLFVCIRSVGWTLIAMLPSSYAVAYKINTQNIQSHTQIVQYSAVYYIGVDYQFLTFLNNMF